MDENVKRHFPVGCATKPPRMARYLWGTDASSLQPPYDIVLVTDVIYDDRFHDQLVDSINRVSHDKTIVYCANRWRT
jgi:predicted nicotinamide N-methyase